jgi:hypothetical protein
LNLVKLLNFMSERELDRMQGPNANFAPLDKLRIGGLRHGEQQWTSR